MIVRALKAIWWAIKWLLGWLCSCFKPTYEPIDIDSGEDSDSDYSRDESVKDSNGHTPRNAENRIDELLNSIEPHIRAQLMREYEIQNRRPPLVPVLRTASAPAEMQTEKAKNEDEVLEEKRGSNENS